MDSFGLFAHFIADAPNPPACPDLKIKILWDKKDIFSVFLLWDVIFSSKIMACFLIAKVFLCLKFSRGGIHV